MTPLRPSREDRGPDPWLGAKMAIFAVAAAFALAGIALENNYFVGTAITLLVVGVVLRFLPPRGE